MHLSRVQDSKGQGVKGAAVGSFGPARATPSRNTRRSANGRQETGPAAAAPSTAATSGEKGKVDDFMSRVMGRRPPRSSFRKLPSSLSAVLATPPRVFSFTASVARDGTATCRENAAPNNGVTSPAQSKPVVSISAPRATPAPASSAAPKSTVAPASSAAKPPAVSKPPASGSDRKHKRVVWRKGSLIGTGSFGKVYRGVMDPSGRMIAIKRFKLDPSGASRAMAEVVQREVALLESLKHPHIVSFLGTERDSSRLSILMEYVAPGLALDKYLLEFGVPLEPMMIKFTWQILSALRCCHGHNIIHRDIKGKNILVSHQGDVKLCDFGSAKRFHDMFSNKRVSTTFNFTPLWTAPEVAKGDSEYNSNIDIWSLGCVVIEMATGKEPWAEMKFSNHVAATFFIGNQNRIPQIPSTLSETAQNFTRLCLQRDPTKRPTAEQIWKHPWGSTTAAAVSVAVAAQMQENTTPQAAGGYE